MPIFEGKKDEERVQKAGKGIAGQSRARRRLTSTIRRKGFMARSASISVCQPAVLEPMRRKRETVQLRDAVQRCSDIRIGVI
jgi:hypothetical protein